MSTVTIREVNQNTSAVFERVRRGEEIIVTRGGHPQARITPYNPENLLEQLIAQGKIIPADPNAPELIPMTPSRDPMPIIEQEREDREYL